MASTQPRPSFTGGRAPCPGCGRPTAPYVRLAGESRFLCRSCGRAWQRWATPSGKKPARRGGRRRRKG